MSATPSKVGIVGASGYGGAELLRLCAGHPDLEVPWPRPAPPPARRVADHTPSLAAAYPTLAYGPTDAAALDGLDVVFLALPHGQSQHLVPDLVDRVGVDRRPGRRLPPGRPGAVPDLVRRGAPGPRPARHLRLRPARAPPDRAASGPPGSPPPGCYPTAALLALAPLVEAGVLSAAGRRGTAAGGRRGQRDLGCRAGPEGQPPLRRRRRGLRRLRAARPPPHRRDGAGPRHHGPVHAPPGPHGAGHPGHLLRPTRRPRRADHGGRHAAPARPRTTTSRSSWSADDPPSTKAASGSNTAHLTVRVDPRTGWVVVLSRHRQPDQGGGRPGRAVRQPGPRPARGRRAAAGGGVPVSITTPAGFVAAGLAARHQGLRCTRPGPGGHRGRPPGADGRHLHHEPGLRRPGAGQPGPPGGQRGPGRRRPGVERQRQRRHRRPGPGRRRHHVPPDRRGPGRGGRGGAGVLHRAHRHPAARWT